MKMKGKAGILVVPLITVVICVAALGGVAYALNTTVSEDGSIDDTGYQVIDLYTAKDTALSAAYTLNGIKIYTQRDADTDTTTILADTTSAVGTTIYVAVHKTANGTAATNPDADLTNAVANPTVTGNTQGWTYQNNTITGTVEGCSVTVTFTIGNAVAEGDLAGYRPVSVSVVIGNGSYSGGAHAAAKAVQTALNGLDFTLTFTSQVA